MLVLIKPFQNQHQILEDTRNQENISILNIEYDTNNKIMKKLKTQTRMH